MRTGANGLLRFGTSWDLLSGRDSNLIAGNQVGQIRRTNALGQSSHALIKPDEDGHVTTACGTLEGLHYDIL